MGGSPQIETVYNKNSSVPPPPPAIKLLAIKLITEFQYHYNMPRARLPPLLLLLLLLASSSAAATNVSIALDGATALHRYDGHGGLSAGASSRLLWDYAEPQRSQILDYMFNTSFGAGFHHLKLEIGGDGQSTDGTEPSHMHTRGDLSCDRGYELWLAVEARRRNPQIALYGLAWTAPGWLNNGTMYGPDTIAYMLAWLGCLHERGAGYLETLGLWNEDAQCTPDYLLELRAALDAGGFGATRIAIMDNAYLNTDEVAEAQANETYAAAVGVAGLHDPCSYNYVPYPQIRALGWDLWASEDFSRDVSDWQSSQNYWMKALSQHYVVMNITATISWSLLWSVYSNLICRDSGLMRARWPQSGYYEVSPTIWLHAHWGQFTQPGWRFLHVPGGGSGFLDVAGAPLHGGTYVSLVPPDRLDALTVIIETSADTSCLRRNLSHFTLTFTTRGGLPGPGTTLFVWSSTQSALFRQLAPVTIAADSSFTVSVAPDSITTVSTVATAAHGSFPDSPVPANLPWDLPYADDFESYAFDAMARYFADQAGSWAVRNGSLTQVSFGQPIAWAPNGDPLSIAGSEDWVDYAVSATARFWPKAPAPALAPVPALPAAPPQQSRGARRRKARFGSGSGSSSAALFAAACDASDGSQVFSYSASSGWLGSPWGPGGSGCATTCGCDPTCLQMWSCGVPGCNARAYNWSLSSSGSGGALTNEAYPSLALAADAAAGTVALVAADGSPAQTWAFEAATGLVRSALGLCLSQLKPSLTYAAVCGRVGSYDGFNPATTPAYCAAVYVNSSAQATWALLVNSRAAASGAVPGGGAFNSSAPHRIAMSMAGDVVEAYLDGVLLGSVNDETYAAGNAAVGAGWHPASFDDFEVTAPFPATAAAAAQRRRRKEV